MKLARRSFTGLALSFAIAAVVFGVIVSPLVLGLLSRANLNWQELSNIGQSYGAISAILSALALLGVIWTLFLQARQAAHSRTYAIRQYQATLLRMAMEDKRYIEAWGNFPAPPGLDRDLVLYTNLMMMYLVSLYETGVSDLDEIGAYASEIFDGAVGRMYWECRREFWLRVPSGKGAKLANKLDTEYQVAVSKGAPTRPLKSNERPKEHASYECIIGRFHSYLRGDARRAPSEGYRTHRA